MRWLHMHDIYRQFIIKLSIQSKKRHGSMRDFTEYMQEPRSQNNWEVQIA